MLSSSPQLCQPHVLVLSAYMWKGTLLSKGQAHSCGIIIPIFIIPESSVEHLQPWASYESVHKTHFELFQIKLHHSTIHGSEVRKIFWLTKTVLCINLRDTAQSGSYKIPEESGSGLCYAWSLILVWNFPGGPVVKSPVFQCRGCGFNPWSGNSDPTCHVVWIKNKKRKNLGRILSLWPVPSP